jgi:hypothetical protein
VVVTLDPGIDAATAREVLHGLAHTTRTLDEPGDMPGMIESLGGSLGSLRQVLDQLANWHERTADQTIDTTGDGDGGYRAAFDVAMQLWQAAIHVEQATDAVAAARDPAGRISWPPIRPATHTGGRAERSLAPPSLFGADTTRPDTAGISR